MSQMFHIMIGYDNTFSNQFNQFEMGTSAGLKPLNRGNNLFYNLKNIL